VTNPTREEFYLLAFETEFKLCAVEMIYKSSTINIPSIFHSRMLISHVEPVMKAVNNSITLSTCTVRSGMYNLQNVLYISRVVSDAITKTQKIKIKQTYNTENGY
jgi:hypothetical protein